jgi:hypothetical protein
MEHETDVSLRHIVATIAYRGSKALRGAPSDFSTYRAAEGSRSACEILAHIGDLFDWVLAHAKGQKLWKDSLSASWDEDSQRFFTALAALDGYLRSTAEVSAPPEKLFQGGLADALTRIYAGQGVRVTTSRAGSPATYSW